MDYRCIYPNCSSKSPSGSVSGSKDASHSVYPFPKESKVRSKWLGSIPGHKKRLTSTSGVCSKHFLIKDFDKKDNLRPGAVPVDLSSLSDCSSGICSLSDLADQLESRPEVIPPHIQHLTSPLEYIFYKIRFRPKEAPQVAFSLIIYTDLSFDVSHAQSSTNKGFKLLQSLQGKQSTFRTIEEIRDVLQFLDDLPEEDNSLRQQQKDDCIRILLELSEGSHSSDIPKFEFLAEQIKYLETLNSAKRSFNKKTLSSFKKLTSTQLKSLGHIMTLPDVESLWDDSLKDAKDFCQHFIENSDFLQNEEFQFTVTSRVAEKDSPVYDIVSKTLKRLWSCNIEEFSLDIYTTVLLLLNELCSLYALDQTFEQDIVIKEEDLGESSITASPVREMEEGSSFIEDDFIQEESVEIAEETFEEVLEEEDFSRVDPLIECSSSKQQVEPQNNSEDEEIVSSSEPCTTSVKFNFNCCFCTKKLATFPLFLDHCEESHSGVDVVLKITPGPVITVKKSLTALNCVDCKKDIYTISDMKHHVEFHAQTTRQSSRAYKKVSNPHTCGLCDAKFIDKKRLKDHYESQHPSYSIFECKRCSSLFYKCSEYLKHKLYFHKKRAVNPDRLYSCEECDKKFRFKHYLDKHYAVDHQQRKYSCESCGRLFDTQRYLTKHKGRVHPNSFDFICELCGKKFAINEYLNSHKKICKYRRGGNVVGEDKKLQCNKCFRFFSSEVYLANHRAVVHDKTKMYVCSVCDKSLSSLVNLKLHMAIHEENRPTFPCEECGKKYLNKTTLQFHFATTHEKHKNEKTFKCKECSWSFWEKKNLRNHVKLVHEKVYEFKCDICERPFGCRRHLLRHKTTIHDKFREFKCHVCSVEYFQRPSLKNHLKKVHNITDYMPPKLVKEEEEEVEEEIT